VKVSGRNFTLEDEVVVGVADAEDEGVGDGDFMVSEERFLVGALLSWFWF